MGSSRAAPEPRSKDYWGTSSGESQDGGSSDTGSERSDGRRWNSDARFLERYGTKRSNPVGYKQDCWTELLEAVHNVGFNGDTPDDLYNTIKDFADCEDPREERTNFLQALRDHRQQGVPTTFRPLLDMLAVYRDSMDLERKHELIQHMRWRKRSRR